MPFSTLSIHRYIQTSLVGRLERLPVPEYGIEDSTQQLVFANRTVDIPKSSLSEVL